MVRAGLLLELRSLFGRFNTTVIMVTHNLVEAMRLGEPIISGLNLNDYTTILEGAIPAALMGIAAQGLFSIQTAYGPTGYAARTVK